MVLAVETTVVSHEACCPWEITCGRPNGFPSLIEETDSPNSARLLAILAISPDRVWPVYWPGVFGVVDETRYAAMVAASGVPRTEDTFSKI